MSEKFIGKFKIKDQSNITSCKSCGKLAEYPKKYCKETEYFCETCTVLQSCCPFCAKKDCKPKKSEYFSEITENIKVYCINSNHGCEWIGIHKDGKFHIDSECNFVPCPNVDKGCLWKGKTLDLESHTPICAFLEIKCEQCDSFYYNKHHETHKNNCPTIINKRNEALKRQQQKDNLLRAKRIKNSVQNFCSNNFYEKDTIVLHLIGKAIVVSRSLFKNVDSPYLKELIKGEQKEVNFNFDYEAVMILLDYIQYNSIYPQYLDRRTLSKVLFLSIFLGMKRLTEEIVNERKEESEIHSLRVLGYCFSSWILKSILFQDCEFSDSIFNEGTQLQKVRFLNSIFKNTSFKNLKLNECSLSDLDFSLSYFEKVIFVCCNLNNTKFPASLKECEFNLMRLDGTDFSERNLQYCKFLKSSILHTDFSYSDLSHAVFSAKAVHTNFSNAIFKDTILPTFMENCNLQNCDLTKVKNLSEIEMINCDTTGSITKGTILENIEDESCVNIKPINPRPAEINTPQTQKSFNFRKRSPLRTAGPSPKKPRLG